MNEIIHFVVILCGLAFICETVGRIAVLISRLAYGYRQKRNYETQLKELEKEAFRKTDEAISTVNKIHRIAYIVPGLIQYMKASIDSVDMTTREGKLKNFENFTTFYQDIVKQNPELEQDLERIVGVVFEQLKADLN